jgi:hypothetical protein
LSTIKPVFISPGKKFEKEITFLHSFATEEICSASLVVVENVQLLSDLSLIGRKNEELIFFTVAKFFASGDEMREWKNVRLSRVPDNMTVYL